MTEYIRFKHYIPVILVVLLFASLTGVFHLKI